MAKVLHASAMLAIATLLGGCSWFGGGKDDVIQPSPPPDVYRSPLKADATRTGDYARAGLLNRRAAATAPATTRAAVAPAVPTPMLASTQRATPTLSEYLVLGSVVANVNGSPIYANDLIAQTAPLLRARARELDARNFRTLAETELNKQRGALIGDELEFAAAQRNTTPDEQRQAQQITFMTRERMISQAGGSEQMARQLAREQGTDFDKQLAQEERRALVGIYYRKRIIPRATVTVDEMRRYYEQNREKQFTTPSTATVRVVKVDVAEVGSDVLAQQKVADARARIASGENFDTISDEFNKAGLLRTSKGLVGPLSKGSYAIAALDAEIWRTPVGQPTPAVKAGNAYYVALVQERRDGRVQQFDEPELQQVIHATLRERKMLEQRQRAIEELQRDAVIQADDAMLAPVVEMAMQLYPAWHAGGR